VAVVVLHDGTELHFFQFIDMSDTDHPQPEFVPRYLQNVNILNTNIVFDLGKAASIAPELYCDSNKCR
jgi:hypothetical protein